MMFGHLDTSWSVHLLYVGVSNLEHPENARGGPASGFRYGGSTPPEPWVLIQGPGFKLPG